jgi:hypothetical protein
MKTLVLLAVMTMNASAFLFVDGYNLTVAEDLAADRPVVEEYLPLSLDNNTSL